jgi:lysophospholipase L1-like esterase
LNGGIAGDSLQNIHWRVRNGLFDVHQPELIVVLAGTNNVGVDSTSAILDGLRTIVEQIHERSSSSKILILKLLPRGDREAAAKQIQEINDRLTDLNLSVADTYSSLAREGKADPSAYLPDGVHLNAIGYARLAEVLREPLRPYQAP